MSLLRRVAIPMVMTVVAAVGLILVPSPASAAPGWQTYTITSRWHCTILNTDHTIASVKSCVVGGTSPYAQAVAIVTNNTGNLIDIQATDVSLFRGSVEVWDDQCNFSRLGAHLSRACFASTVSVGCDVIIYANVTVLYSVANAPWKPAARGWSPQLYSC